MLTWENRNRQSVDAVYELLPSKQVKRSIVIDFDLFGHEASEEYTGALKRVACLKQLVEKLGWSHACSDA